MPTYTYECPRGHRFDEVRKIAERDDPISCSRIVCLTTRVMRGEGVCDLPAKRIEIAGAPVFIAHPGVGDRAGYHRDRDGK